MVQLQVIVRGVKQPIIIPCDKYQEEDFPSHDLAGETETWLVAYRSAKVVYRIKMKDLSGYGEVDESFGFAFAKDPG